MAVLYFFLLGLVIGSFLNCLIYRLETNQSFIFGRSFCPNCRQQLAWPDLIPLFSFLILKGRCRYCQKKISWQYPLVELATGLIFLLVFNFYFAPHLPQIITTFYFFIISSFLIIIFVYDLKHYLIPDKIIDPAIFIAFIFNCQFLISQKFPIFLSSILSAILASLFFLTIVLISKEKWLGFGDTKLAFLMGLFLGFPKILIALFLAFFLGAIIGIGLILAKKKEMKSQVAFGPFLVSGTFLALFFGEKIFQFYLKFLWK